MTVGVVGTGKIGEALIRILSGFGCRILACSPTEKETVKPLARYCSFETLCRESDIITLHAPATPETFHMIDRRAFASMKDGVVLINMARGSLVCTDDLIDALESGKVGAAALDVIEGETGIYYSDFKYQPVKHRQMAVLQAMPNVLMTPHTAFFSDEAVDDMVRYSIENLRFRSFTSLTKGGAHMKLPWKTCFRLTASAFILYLVHPLLGARDPLSGRGSGRGLADSDRSRDRLCAEYPYELL